MDPVRLKELARRHGVRLLLRFGSSVGGPMHAGSDVDFAALLERAPDSLAVQADLAADLQSLVPDREVDVAILNRADPLFLKQIVDRCELEFGSPARLDALKLYAFKRYQDHRRFLRLEGEYVDRAIERLAGRP
jgi:predicted nucleotidyltransferase